MARNPDVLQRICRTVPNYGENFPRIEQGLPQDIPNRARRRHRPLEGRDAPALTPGDTSTPDVADTGAMDRTSSRTAPEGAAGIDVGLAVEDWTGDARFYEYSAAVDPVGSGLTTRVPVRRFPAQWHEPGSTRVVALDLSDVLGTPYPATGPALLARFLCIAEGEGVDLAANATSALFYCLRGRGTHRGGGAGGHRDHRVAGGGRGHPAG